MRAQRRWRRSSGGISACLFLLVKCGLRGLAEGNGRGLLATQNSKAKRTLAPGRRRQRTGPGPRCLIQVNGDQANERAQSPFAASFWKHVAQGGGDVVGNRRKRSIA